MKNPISRNLDLLAVLILVALFGISQPQSRFRFFETLWSESERHVRTIHYIPLPECVQPER
jgi:hypothetical protein